MSDRKKRFIATLAATMAGLGVLISGAFNSPDDMFNNEMSEKNRIVIEANTKEKEKAPLVSRIPFLIKAIFAVPLWLLGSLVVEIIDKLLKFTLLPLAKFLLLWLLLFLIILVIIVACVKLLYPEMSLKEILSRKLIIRTALVTLSIMLITTFLPVFYKEYDKYKYVGIFVMGLIEICFELLPFIRKKANEPVIIYDEI